MAELEFLGLKGLVATLLVREIVIDELITLQALNLIFSLDVDCPVTASGYFT
jgi:hypothetical protein